MPPRTQRVPSEQTIAVKGLNHDEVPKVQGFVAKYTNALGVALQPDYADKDTERFLLYCNYNTPLEATNAEGGLVQFILQTFPKISEFHQVVRKSDLIHDKPLFSLCLMNIPNYTPSNLYRYLCKVIESVLPGVPVYHPKGESPGVMFVRFQTYEAANQMLQLSKDGKLRAEGLIMHAAPARNTSFVMCLLDAMDAEQSTEWSLDKVRAFVRRLPATKWPPMTCNIELILRAVPEEFALDEDEDKVYRVCAPGHTGAGITSVSTSGTSACVAPPPPTARLVGSGAPGARAATQLVKPSTPGPHTAASHRTKFVKPDTPGPRAAASHSTKLAKPARGRAGAAPTRSAAPVHVHTAQYAMGVEDTHGPLPMPAGKLGLIETNVRALGAVCTPLRDFPPAVAADGLGGSTEVRFKPFPWLCLDEAIPPRWEDEYHAFNNLGIGTLPEFDPTGKSRFEFANVGVTCEASEPSSADGPPPSPCLSTSTEIKPEDSRSMCSQAPTHMNTLRAWGVQQVADFFDQMGFAGDSVREASVDGDTLLQKFEEQDVDFFTQPFPDGLGLTKVQYKGRLQIELQRCMHADQGHRAGL